jgi:protein-tyrosine-phosphatase
MSYALPELYARTSTRILADRPALSNWLAGHDHASGPILLERMFAGFGLGVSVLCDRGAILQAFEHHRAHEVDGSSYYRKSAPLEAGRLDAVARMVKASAYTGLAMFEFKVDPKSGNWILIEVNARPWGSLPLPVSIGVDFPYRLYRLLALGDPTPPVPYPSQRYCRNLLLDMYQVKAGAGPLVRQPGKLIAHCLAWVWGFHRVLLGREHHDALVLDDPQPGLLELRRLFGARLSPAAGKPRPGAGLAARLAALDPAQGPVDVLFVCQGNINRSSYAELKSTQLMGNEKLRFASAGMLPRNRRGSPAVAIGAAALHGVDMSAHRSRHASAELLEAATVIIVFDQINLRSIRQRYPALRNQVFLLGELIASDGAREIADPEGKTEATFLATYAQIDACLAELSRAIAVPPTH